VFVKDRGPGFDLDEVAPDRMGVGESILGRMRRHGGKAEIRTAPGEGTEVRLTARRAPAAGGRRGESAGSEAAESQTAESEQEEELHSGGRGEPEYG